MGGDLIWSVKHFNFKETDNINEIIAEAFAAMFSVYTKYILAGLLKNDKSLKLITFEMEFPLFQISYG